MYKDIVGRDKEKKKLDLIMQSGQSEFLAVYGRRRVGKTFLIRTYLKDHIVFDISGSKEGSKERQILNFFNEYTLRKNEEKGMLIPMDWYGQFELLAAYLKSLPKSDKKHVVFLDEMPWMDTPKSEFVSALDFFWNQHISKMNNILLIACGSASSWILKKLIRARGGLYNRVSHRMKLHPFTLNETKEYLLSKNIDLPDYQILELYMTMGGIPFYLKEIQGGKSSIQIIDEMCFADQGLLNQEYSQLYHSLFKNAEFHISIVEALGSSPQGLSRSKLKEKVKISEGMLNKTLEELIECDFISRYLPLQNKKKDTIYKLTDAYSLFYIKFIQSNKGGSGNQWEQLSKESTYRAWSGYAFENICMTHIDQIKKALGISGVFTKHSSWKYAGDETMPGTQIDMIIDRADNIIHLCEAKFTKEPFAITKDYSEKLRLKKSIFKQVTETKKGVFTTLLTTYPAIKNKYYMEEINNEISMEDLFEINI